MSKSCEGSNKNCSSMHDQQLWHYFVNLPTYDIFLHLCMEYFLHKCDGYLHLLYPLFLRPVVNQMSTHCVADYNYVK